MKVLFVLCAPQRPSFGLTLAEAIKERLLAQGHELAWHDLYEEGFNPVMDPGELARGGSLDELVQAHARDLEACDGLVIVHPDWWGQSPAILKGWLDRVFRQGIAYELEGEEGLERTWRGCMAGKKALVFVTSDSLDPRRPELFRETWVDVVLGPCGFEAACRVIGGLRSSTAAARAAWLRDSAEQALATFGNQSSR